MKEASRTRAHTDAHGNGRISSVPTPEQQDEFLKLLASGVDKATAAEEVGSSATKFRGLATREPDFGQRYRDAEESYRDSYGDVLRKEMKARALDRADPASSRLLVHQAETYLSELEHKRTRRVHVGGDVNVRAIPWVDPQKLDEMEPERLAMLKELMLEILAERQPPELEAGDVIDD